MEGFINDVSEPKESQKASHPTEQNSKNLHSGHNEDLINVSKPKKSQKASHPTGRNSKNLPSSHNLCKSKCTVEQDLGSDEDVFKPKKSNNLSSHKKSNSIDSFLGCNLCKRTFTQRKNLLAHMRMCGKPHEKPKDISLNCKVCQKVITNAPNRRHHERICARFMCTHCEKRFNSKRFLDSHVRKIHSAHVTFKCTFCNACFKQKGNCKRHESTCKTDAAGRSEIFECAHCSLQFNRKDILRRHLNKCSIQSPSKEFRKNKCLIQQCHQYFLHKRDLINHLTTSHKNEITITPKKTLDFSSIDEFKLWKEKEETETFSYFTARRGEEKIRNYYCQHDGSAKTHNKYNKERKSVRRNRKGRVKVGHCCIAKIKVTINDNKTVRAEYYPTHSHKCNQLDILHHPLPAEISKYIEEKLAEHIPPDIVYNMTRERFVTRNNEELSSRTCILTKKRVLERWRKRQKERRLDPDDAKSVYLFVEQTMKKDNSILLYKPVGQGVVVGPKEIDNLPDSDQLFMFAFQTAEQLEQMKQHGSKILVVDETHGTNQYKYRLLTVMVIDNERHGWPVGFLITSQSDAETLKFFFEALQYRVGKEVSFNCAITDDDNALINAMEKGFSKTLIHLLCKWHILKKLKEKLRRKVPKNLVEPMFNEIKVIVDAVDETQFLQLKEGFLSKYKNNSDTAKYLLYLNKHYWPRAKKWASCYRDFPHAGVNTTGHVESFHNRLKKWYLNRKVNKRIDDLINILYTISWDDNWSRSRNAKLGYLLPPGVITESHKRGIKLDDKVIIEKATGVWEVKSKSGFSCYYIERKQASCDLDNCSRCTQPACHRLCPHLFFCSCPNHYTNPSCKHIHKLQSLLFRDIPFVSREGEFYHLETPNTVNEEVNDNACAHKSASEEESVHDRKKRIDLELLKVQVSTLQQVLNRAPEEIPDHFISRGRALLSDFLASVEVGSAASVKKVPAMKPAESFTPNEKLKRQLDQLPSFKKPRKIKPENNLAVAAAKKRATKEDLLSYASCHTDAVENFENPEIENVENPEIENFENPHIEHVQNPINMYAVNWDAAVWEFEP